MTDLTEQWKKGELPNGWYYVRLIRGEYRIDLYINDKNEWIDCPDNIIDTVVCKVPSYDEWEKLNNACHELEKETACLTVDNVNLKKWCEEFNALDVAKENAKLKIDCHTLAQKLLQFKPELREWLEVNYKEYL